MVGSWLNPRLEETPSHHWESGVCSTVVVEEEEELELPEEEWEEELLEEWVPEVE